MPSTFKDKHIIRSFRGGFSEESQRGLSGAFKFGQNLDIRKFEDTLSCNQAMSKISGSTVVDLPQASIDCSDGNQYWFGNAGKIYKNTSGDVVSLLHTDTDGAINGAAEWAGDIYWATDTKLKKTPVSSPNFASPTVVSSALTSGQSHFMKVIVNALYICNGEDIAVVNFAGTFSVSATYVPPTMWTTCLDEADTRLIIGSKMKNDNNVAFLHSFDVGYLDLVIPQDIDFRKQIPSKYINSMITSDLPLCHAGNSIHYADFSNIAPIFKIDDSVCKPYAVAQLDNLALFGLTGCSTPGIYSYGRKNRNMPHVFNLEYTLTPTPASSITDIGAIAVRGNKIYVSWKSGSNYGIDVLDTANKAVAIYQSLEFHTPKKHVDPFHIGQIKVVTKPLPDNNVTVGLAYRKDKASSWTTMKTVDDSSTFGGIGLVEGYFDCGEDFVIYELQVTLTPYANLTPEVIRIEAYIT